MFNQTLISMTVQVALLVTVARPLHPCMNRQVRVRHPRRILWRDDAPRARVPNSDCRFRDKAISAHVTVVVHPSLAASQTEGNNGTALDPAASRVPRIHMLPSPDGNAVRFLPAVYRLTPHTWPLRARAPRCPVFHARTARRKKASEGVTR
jgi:hypothetical protein